MYIFVDWNWQWHYGSSQYDPGQLTSLKRAKDIHLLEFKPDGTVSAKLKPGDPSSFPVRVKVVKKGVGAGK